MPLTLRIESELDERSATAAATRAERIYTESAQKMSRELSEGLTKGAREGGAAVEKMATDARNSYKQVGDATDELRQQERQLKEMRDEGARGVEVQAERVRQARRREKDAIKEAAAAYDEYERAARGAGDAGEQAGNQITSGLRTAVGGAAGAGQDTAEGFLSGFAGASALTRLSAAGGPVGLALGGMAALGVTAGKVLADNIAAGMQSLATEDLFRTRMGVDEATMRRYGQAAGGAWADGWGESRADNLSTLQFAIQGRLIDRDSTEQDVQYLISQMQAVSDAVDADPREITRGTRAFIDTGMVDDYQGAFDLIVAANAQGLNLSDDLLDTMEEYGTKFRDVGLDGSEALGLINQMWEGGARNADVAADGLKEFAINVSDGSELTGQAFEAMGFNADQMRSRFIEGGAVARQSLGEVLTAMQGLGAEEREQVGQALFKTKWEDMGDAVLAAHLDTAAQQLGDIEGAAQNAADAQSAHVDQWVLLRRNIDETFGDLQRWLADTTIGQFFGVGLPQGINDRVNQLRAGDVPVPFTYPGGDLTPGAPGVAPVPGVAPGPAVAAPGTAGGNPLDIFAPVRPSGAPPAAAPGSAAPPADRQEPIPMPDAGAASSNASTSLPDAPTLPLQYTSTAGLPTAIANAQTRLDEAAHAAAEKQARLNQLRQSNLATEEDIQKAANDLTKAERDRQQAEQALHDAKMSAYEKQTQDIGEMSSAMGEVGAALDKDLGISDGLAGIAENFVRFLASVAAAPLVGQLSAIANANPNEGSGLTGILAAQGVFGSQYTPSAIGAQGVSASNMGPYALQPGVPQTSFAAQPGTSAREFAHSTMLPFFESQGFTVGDHAADKYGEHQNGALDIMVDSIAEGNAVLQQVLSDPNAYGAIFNNQTYGYGQGAGPRPYSGGNTGNPTQDHQDHVHVWYKPGGDSNIASGAPSPSMPRASGSGLSPGMTPSWGGPVGVPTGVSGGGGQSPVFGATPGIPIGSGAGARMPGVSPGIGNMAGSPANLGGQPYPAQGGEGGVGIGGMALDGIMAATSGLDMMAPGAGAAAKIGIQVANRTAKYAGQVTGILAGGLLDTITPAGDNPKASIGNSWLGKGLGGLAGAAPAIPNIAGGKGKQPPGPMDGPGGQAAGQQGQGGNNVTNNLTLNNNHATEDMAGNQAVRELGAMYSTPGSQ